jgi:hypothetical protein
MGKNVNIYQDGNMRRTVGYFSRRSFIRSSGVCSLRCTGAFPLAGSPLPADMKNKKMKIKDIYSLIVLCRNIQLTPNMILISARQWQYSTLPSKEFQGYRVHSRNSYRGS